MTAAEVMNRAASLLNDRQRSIYTYDVQIPYLNMAIDELQEELQNHNVSVTNEVSTVATLPAGSTTIANLPPDLVEIRAVYESDSGRNEFSPMRKATFLPKNVRPTASLVFWSPQKDGLVFTGANATKDIMVEYIAKIQPPVNSSDDNINILNSKSFLAYRTAGLCSEFVGENPTRAGSLNAFASMAFDRMLGTNIKSGQMMGTRRRPFMAGYKSRR